MGKCGDACVADFHESSNEDCDIDYGAPEKCVCRFLQEFQILRRLTTLDSATNHETGGQVQTRSTFGLCVSNFEVDRVDHFLLCSFDSLPPSRRQGGSGNAGNDNLDQNGVDKLRA